MKEYIFNEKSDIEHMMSLGFVDTLNPCKTIRKLARYNYYVLKMSDKENYDMINSYMGEHCNEYTEVGYYRSIQGCIRDASKSPWKEIDRVCITKLELDTILSLNDEKKEKIAFVILADAKYDNAYKKANVNLSYLSLSNIYQMARVTMPISDRAMFLHFLYEKGLVEYNLNPSSTNKRLNYIFDGPDVILELDEGNYKSLAFTYMNWKHGGYKRCKKCGTLIKLNKNTQYCKECTPKYEKKPDKILNCIDCGEEFSVDPRNMTKCRCDKCQKEHIKEYDRERKSNK